MFDNAVNTLTTYYTKTTSDANYQTKILTTANISASNIVANGTLSGSGVTTLLSPYDLTSSLSSQQSSLTSTLPLSIASSVISINLSSYALKAGTQNLQTSLIAALPLSIASNNLSIDLSSYTTTTAVNTAITDYNSARIKSVYQL